MSRISRGGDASIARETRAHPITALLSLQSPVAVRKKGKRGSCFNMHSLLKFEGYCKYTGVDVKSTFDVYMYTELNWHHHQYCNIN